MKRLRSVWKSTGVGRSLVYKNWEKGSNRRQTPKEPKCSSDYIFTNHHRSMLVTTTLFLCPTAWQIFAIIGIVIHLYHRQSYHLPSLDRIRIILQHWSATSPAFNIIFRQHFNLSPFASSHATTDHQAVFLFLLLFLPCFGSPHFFQSSLFIVSGLCMFHIMGYGCIIMFYPRLELN